MANIIVTGFMPFKGDEFNPTVEVTKYMDRRSYDGDKVTSAVLPVTFKGESSASEMMSHLIDDLKPHLVLGLGLSKAEIGTRREDLNLEKRGRNIMHAKNPDATGYAPKNEVITPDGPEFYETMFALKGEELVQALRENGVRARTSDDAVKYVCNALIYKTAEKISREGLDSKFGFIHMPWLDSYTLPCFYAAVEQDYKVPEGKSAMPLEEVVKGIELIIERA